MVLMSNEKIEQLRAVAEIYSKHERARLSKIMTEDTTLPNGYSIIDGLEEPHDGDVEDGRYMLYVDGEDGPYPLGNSHELKELYRGAWAHYRGKGF